MKKKENLTVSNIRSYNTNGKRIEIYDSVTSGLCLRVTKNGTKSFSYEYRIGGKNRRITFGTYPHISLQQARAKCREARYMIDQGLDPKYKIDERKNSDSLLLGTLIKEYKDYHLVHLKPKTRMNYNHYLDNRIDKKLGKLDVRKIRRIDIIRFLDEIAVKEGFAVTANRTYATVSSLFTFALERGYIVEDPTKGIPKRPEKSKERYYSNDEIKKLWSYFNSMKMPTGSLYKILLLYGRRKTETMLAEWTHIQEDKWTFPKENVKNSNELVLPVTDIVKKELAVLKKYSGKNKYVFASPVIKGQPIKSDSYARQKVQKNCIEDFCPHDLRRTAITKLAEVGTPEHIGKKIANHTQGVKNDVFNVYNRYQYLDEMRIYLSKYHEELEMLI